MKVGKPQVGALWLALVAVAFVSRSAKAGSYAVSYSGGSVVTSGSAPTPTRAQCVWPR